MTSAAARKPVAKKPVLSAKKPSIVQSAPAPQPAQQPGGFDYGLEAELFPAHVRALGVALPYAISNAIFGALVEPRALAWKRDGHENYFYIYIAVLMAVGLRGFYRRAID